MIWCQTLRGRAFDLIHPKPEMVDFAEIADQLSTLHRYAGAAEKPVSVALHTLIACDAAEEFASRSGVRQPLDAASLKAHILLHDAHEAFIGDIVTPAAHAIHEIIRLRAGHKDAENFSDALAALKGNIDAAIFAAAGLMPPTPMQAQAVKFADLKALVTERRDFLAKPPRPWADAIEAIAPMPKKYRLRPAPDVAAELLGRFKTYLPALRHGPASAGRLSSPGTAA